MSLPPRIPSLAWLLIPACALGFILWGDNARQRRVEFVSHVARDGAAVSASSLTGYADGKRWLIVPEHNNPTYQWIEETQGMLAKGEWRVRFVDYENSPFGRDVHSASPYRWWLVAVAWVDHALSGRPLALSVERAALTADPVLHLLLLSAAAFFVSRRLGRLAGAVTAAALAALYPVAATFLPGVANDFGLTQIAAFWSVLLLAAAVREGGYSRRLFAMAGVAGGCGLWLSAAGQLPLILGTAVGAVLSSAILRGSSKPLGVAPWRAWSYAGAVTSLAAYLIEYFPSHMNPELRANYPLYGLAWIGLGEVLHRVDAFAQGGKPFQKKADIGCLVLAVVAVASLPIALRLGGNGAFLAGDLLSSRLTNLPGGVFAPGLRAWAIRDGIGGAFVATCLPAVLLVPALWLVLRTKTGAGTRAALALSIGPACVALVLAYNQLRWWNTFDLVLIAMLAASCDAIPTFKEMRRASLCWGTVVAALLAVSVVQLIPAPTDGSADFKYTRAEIEGLYERALSQWIADHAGADGATVLVPPFRTSSFCFYGGLRGLGTQNWENRDGLSATFRIVNSTRPDETLALVNQRGVTHIVVPSWDNDLDDFARMGLKQPLDSFIYALHRTDGGIFNWLRALPYNLPEIPGFNEQSVLVLQVTDETDPATLRSRLAEYLVEMHQLDQAAYTSQALLRYPADLGALVALAHVAKAKGDDEAFSKDLASIISNLSSGSDRTLPFDRRVSLAVALALGGRNDLAAVQVKRCMGEIDETKIRFLTTGSLYHLLVLCKHFDMEVTDPVLHALSMKLLPSELRERL
ncbi:MAG TPA: hypothetical protein VFE25_08000 [Opitutaceae bacterium]|jgi:hypothetical protein|nr:hypothetical protein [Opitutaceae bacterium]